MTATVQAPPAIPAIAAIAGGSRSSRRPLVLAGLAAGVAVLFLLALAVGSVAVPLDETLRVLVGAEPRYPRWTVVVGQIRLPRALTAALAGAVLGVAGLQMQTLFRNPLADPYSLGVSSGASLGVALVVAGVGGSGGTFTAQVAGSGRFGVVIAGAAGAAIVLAAVLLLANWVRSVVTLLLTWTAPERAIQYWTWSLGSFAGTSTGALPRHLARERDLAVVVSTHDLELSLRVADGVWLLDRTGTLHTGRPAEVIASGAVNTTFDGDDLRFDPVTRTFELREAM
ncbi:iron chelate uptake ABC transporter family permease subunit [Parafrankia soli]|uniref:iron chelate uptake ABC transporter family permease subunit n=1 Tax=Parafrankia soli TaxID=2599596 RepID=UPI003B585ECF